MKLNFSLSLLFLTSTCLTSTASASTRSAPPRAHELSSEYTFDQYVIDFQKLYKNNHQHDADDDEYQIRKEIFESNLRLILSHNENVVYDLKTGRIFADKDEDEDKDKQSHMQQHQEQHQNKRKHSFHMGVNHLMDLNEDELKSYFYGYDKSLVQRTRTHTTTSTSTATSRHLNTQNHEMDLPFEITDINTLPISIQYNRTTPIKNQGSCGSCWSFSSIAALEGHLALRTNAIDILSTQELISCVTNPNHCGGEGGCTGATAELAYEYIATRGILRERSLPYEADDSITCPLGGGDGTKDHDHETSNILPFANTMLRHQNKKRKVEDDTKKNTNNDHDDDNDNDDTSVIAKIEGYAKVPSNNYKALMNAVAKHGPVVIAAAASSWSFYEGGVYSPTDSADAMNANIWDLNHGIVVEGYGTDKETGEDYWLVRNSWGGSWGEEGYIRLKRVDPDTLNDPDGDCGFDETPIDGVACELNPDGSHIVPHGVKVCGTNGMLFDPVIPVGGYLL
jgi:cathepsin L